MKRLKDARREAVSREICGGGFEKIWVSLTGVSFDRLCHISLETAISVFVYKCRSSKIVKITASKSTKRRAFRHSVIFPIWLDGLRSMLKFDRCHLIVDP